MTNLSPCPSCRRHVRVHESCPFCGASVQPSESEPRAGRFSRSTMVTLGAMGVALSVETACGAVYGGPPIPKRPYSLNDKSKFYTSDDQGLDSFEAHARAAGCKIVPYEWRAQRTLYAVCKDGVIGAYHDGPLRVGCEDLDETECRAFYQRIMK